MRMIHRLGGKLKVWTPREARNAHRQVNVPDEIHQPTRVTSNAIHLRAARATCMCSDRDKFDEVNG